MNIPKKYTEIPEMFRGDGTILIYTTAGSKNREHYLSYHESETEVNKTSNHFSKNLSDAIERQMDKGDVDFNHILFIYDDIANVNNLAIEPLNNFVRTIRPNGSGIKELLILYLNVLANN